MADEEKPQTDGSKPLVDIKVNANLKGIGELNGVLNNLIKALSRGVGRAYEPLGRYLDARADRAVINERAQLMIDLAKKRAELAQIESKLATTPKSLPSSAADRAFETLIADTFRKQANRERIADETRLALEHSPPEQDTTKVIDDDWLTQFWSIAENVTHQEVRGFLAKLLAQEIAKPDSISPLTLRVLTTITPHIALRFEHLCRLTIRDDDEVFVIHPNVFPFQNVGPLDMFGISYKDLFELEAYGLLRSAETIRLNWSEGGQNEIASSVDYVGRPAVLIYSGLQLHLLKLTRAGAELRNLLVFSEIPEYTRALMERLGEKFKLSGAE